MAECTGQCVGLTIRQSRVRFLLWPLAGFVLNCSKFKSSATLVNSQLVQPPSQLGFLILICSICIICYRIICVECLQTSSILFFHYNKQTFNLEPLIKLNLAYKVLFFYEKVMCCETERHPSSPDPAFPGPITVIHVLIVLPWPIWPGWASQSVFWNEVGPARRVTLLPRKGDQALIVVTPKSFITVY